jgi:VanZ family protein
MRVLLVLVWAAVIFVLTCTSSFRGLVEFGVVRFVWDSQPVFDQFLESLPGRISTDFLLQKLGHIGAFFILTSLLQTKLKPRWVSLIIAAAYAGLTEILQLFFTRDGRLFDIGFDMIGVMLALGLGSLFFGSESRQSIQK